LKVHRGAYKEISFLAETKGYDEFKELCRVHGLTTCHLFNSFMFAMVEAFKRGSRVEWDPKTENLRAQVGSNPIVVNLTQNFPARPRGHGKYDVGALGGFEPSSPRVYCAFCGGFSGSLVFCQRYGSNWLPSARCVDCTSNFYKKKGEG
jgi:hypothetical protein